MSKLTKASRVIISSDLEPTVDFKNFTLVRKFRDVKSLNMTEISILIIHNFKETDFDAGVFITDFYQAGIKTFVYLSKDPSITIKMILSGIKGFVFDDDFYLEDEDELLGLIEDLGIEEGESLADTSATIVGDFIQSFARGEERIKAPLYLEQVTEAVNELSKSVNQKEYQITVMGESAMGIFAKASELIRKISLQKNKLEGQLQDLQRVQNSAQNIKPTSFSNNVQIFPQIDYLRMAKLLLVREFTPCRYLTSFLIMYNQYLKYSLHKRTKFIILYRNCFCEAQRYENFVKISEQTSNMDSFYDKEFLAINSPKRDIMNKVFDKGADIFIVLDRMYETVPMIKGNRIKTLNAVSGIRDTEIFKIKPEETIMSIIENQQCFFVLKTLGKYPKDFDAQVRAYIQMYQAYFNKLDKFIEF